MVNILLPKLQVEHADTRDEVEPQLEGAVGKEIFTLIPTDAGPRVATPRGGAVYSLRPPGQMNFVSNSHFFAVMLSPSHGMRSSFSSDKLQDFDAPPGMVVVSPANVESTAIWPNPRENIVISVEPQHLENLAAHEFDVGLPELVPLPFGTVDPMALRIAQTLQRELSAGVPANELYVDALITMFSVHMLRTYASGRPLITKGRLPFQKKKILDEYIMTNLGRKLAISDLAAVCGLSPGYFMRTFAKTYGQPPHGYIMDLRLNLAQDLLRGSGLSIAQIAYAAGFNSQSHLTTAMRSYRGVTPALLRSES